MDCKFTLRRSLRLLLLILSLSSVWEITYAQSVSRGSVGRRESSKPVKYFDPKTKSRAGGKFTVESFSTKEQVIAQFIKVFLGDIPKEYYSNIDVKGKYPMFGKLTNGGVIGFEEGFVLTTGDASMASGPNSARNGASKSYSYKDEFSGDHVLDYFSQGKLKDEDGYDDELGTRDACVIEFDFIPQTDRIEFEYVFGSDEYHEYVNRFFDVFGFFISGPGIKHEYGNYSNIALVPGTKKRVSVATINCGHTNGFDVDKYGEDNYELPGKNPSDHCNLLVDNNRKNGDKYPEYDAYTVVLKASADVVPCKRYHMKLVIADVKDKALDSGVFLKSNSFNIGKIKASSDYSNPDAGDALLEGCNNVDFSLEIDPPLTESFGFDFEIEGSATNGEDYDAIPIEATIKPGKKLTLNINALADGKAEPMEEIILKYPSGLCPDIDGKEEVKFLLKDLQPINVNLGSDISRDCHDEVSLSSTVTGGSGIPENFKYEWNGKILNAGAPYRFDLEGEKTVKLKVTDNCGQSDEDIVNVSVNPIVVDLGDDQSICDNSKSLNVSSSVDADEYKWYLNGTLISNSTKDISLSSFPKTNNILRCFASNECGSNDDDEIQITTFVKDTKLKGKTEICKGEEVVLTAGDGVEGQYIWSYRGYSRGMQWKKLEGKNTKSITVNPKSSTSYKVSIKSKCNGSRFESEILNVVVANEDESIFAIVDEVGNELAEVLSNVCSTKDLELRCTKGNNLVTFEDIKWYDETGKVLSEGATYRPVLDKSKKIFVKSSPKQNRCIYEDKIELIVKVIPEYSLSTKKNSVCSGDKELFEVKGQTNRITSLKPKFSTSGSYVDAIVQETQISPPKSYKLIYNKTGHVRTYAQLTVDGCPTNTNTLEIEVIQKPDFELVLASRAVSPDLTVCSNDQIKIKAVNFTSKASNFVYDWSSSFGATLIEDVSNVEKRYVFKNDSDDKSIEKITLRVSKNGCASEEDFIVKSLPYTNISIIGDNEVCEDKVLSFSASNSNASDISYKWNPGKGTIESGSVSSSGIKVKFEESGKQKVSLETYYKGLDNQKTCKTTKKMPIVVRPKPDITISLDPIESGNDVDADAEKKYHACGRLKARLHAEVLIDGKPADESDIIYKWEIITGTSSKAVVKSYTGKSVDHIFNSPLNGKKFQSYDVKVTIQSKSNLFCEHYELDENLVRTYFQAEPDFLVRDNEGKIYKPEAGSKYIKVCEGIPLTFEYTGTKIDKTVVKWLFNDVSEGSNKGDKPYINKIWDEPVEEITVQVEAYSKAWTVGRKDDNDETDISDAGKCPVKSGKSYIRVLEMPKFEGIKFEALSKICELPLKVKLKPNFEKGNDAKKLITYKWHFGDEATPDEISSFAEEITHNYSSVGAFTPKLTLTNDGVCSVTKLGDVINVYPDLEAEIEIENLLGNRVCTETIIHAKAVGIKHNNDKYQTRIEWKFRDPKIAEFIDKSSKTIVDEEEVDFKFSLKNEKEYPVKEIFYNTGITLLYRLYKLDEKGEKEPAFACLREDNTSLKVLKKPIIDSIGFVPYRETSHCMDWNIGFRHCNPDKKDQFGNIITYSTVTDETLQGTKSVFKWTIDGVEYSNDRKFSNKFDIPGLKNVKLEVSNVDKSDSANPLECTTTEERPILIDAPVNADFTINNKICQNEEAILTITDYASDIEYIWKIDNVPVNFNGTGGVYKHTFDLAKKNIDVELTASRGACTSVNKQTIEVVEQPLYALLAPDYVCEGIESKFSLSSGAKSDSYKATDKIKWDFDNDGFAEINSGSVIDYAYVRKTVAESEKQTLKVIVDRQGVCKQELTKEIDVRVTPASDFTIIGGKPLACSNGNELILRCKGQPIMGLVPEYEWTFSSIIDDVIASSNSTGQVNVVWKTAGVKKVNLFTSYNGCSSKSESDITVYKTPESDFSFDTPICEEFHILFTNKTPEKEELDHVWSVNGVEKGSTTDLSHDFVNVLGDHEVSLTVTNNKMCPVTKQKTVSIQEKPSAKFEVTESDVCDKDELEIIFKGKDLGGKREWYCFNDKGEQLDNSAFYTKGGDPEKDEKFNIIFNEPGIYKIECIITGLDCEDIFEQDVRVYPTPEPNIILSDLKECGVFTAKITCEGANIIKDDRTYKWFIGSNPVIETADSTISQYFDTEGIYDISVTVFNHDICPGTAKADTPIEVKEIPTHNIIIPNDKDEICEKEELNVKITTSVGQACTVEWLYDDGIVGTDPLKNNDFDFFVHWNGSGFKTLKSRITHDGCSNGWKNQKIEVIKVPFVDINVDENQKCEINKFKFDATTSNNLDDPIYEWIFSDDPTLVEKGEKVEHVFPGIGTYDVNLKVINRGKCSNEKNEPEFIEITEIPVAAFEVIESDRDTDDDVICQGSEIKIVYKGTPGKHIVRNWSYEGASTTGNPETDDEFILKFDKPGDHEIKLIVENNTCPSPAASRTLLVHPKPVVNFVATSDRVGCGELSATFECLTKESSGIKVDYKWVFGPDNVSGSNTSIQKHAEHPYNVPGTYDVNLIIRYNDYCESNLLKEDYIRIKEVPTADFEADRYIVCERDSVHFTHTGVANGDPYYVWKFEGGEAKGSILAKELDVNWKESNPAAKVSLYVLQDECSSDTIENFIEIVKIPEVSFTKTPDNECGRYDYKFSSTSTRLADPVTYDWNFGDGQTAHSTTSNEVSHIYSYASDFDVILKVENKGLCSASDTILNFVSIKEKPISKFELSSDKECAGNEVTVTFKGVENSKANRDWNFNGGAVVGLNDSDSDEFKVKWSDYGIKNITLSIEQEGCYSDDIHTESIDIVPVPVPEYTISEPKGCADHPVTFTSTTVVPKGYTPFYYWDFGDGSTGEDKASIGHTYEKAGDWEPKLIVDFNKTCHETSKQKEMVSVLEKPKGDFSINKIKGCTGDTIIVTVDPSTFGNRKWNLDGGEFVEGTGKSDKFKVAWKTGGEKKIELVVSNGICESGEIQKTVTIIPRPIVDFTVDKEERCGVGDITFTPKCTNILPDDKKVKYDWKFNDGNTTSFSNLEILLKNFDKIGVYDVELTVTNDNLCSSSEEKLEFIKVKQIPTSDFLLKKSSACEEELAEIEYTGSCSADAIRSYDFDGGDFTDGNPKEDDIFNVSWSAAGVNDLKTVSLKVIQDGCESKKTSTQEIRIVKVPVVDFEASATKGCGELDVKFTNKTTNISSDPNDVDYTWTFGDGFGAEEKDPRHPYTKVGEYKVKLEVWNENKCRSEIEKDLIEIKKQPSGDFKIAKLKGCENERIQITYKGDKDDDFEYKWTLSDGVREGDDDKIFDVYWEDYGAKEVGLTVKLKGGDCEVVADNQTVTVVPNPVASFIYDERLKCKELRTQFTDKTFVPAEYKDKLTYYWDFGDSKSITNNSTDADPFHDYENVGQFDVTLTVKVDNLCSDDTISDKLIEVVAKPVSDFTIDKDLLCENEETIINFEGSASSNADFDWKGTEDAEIVKIDDKRSKIKWKVGGKRSVTLEITDGGCVSDLTEQTVDVVKVPKVDFVNLGKNNECGETKVIFKNESTNLEKEEDVTYEWNFGNKDGAYDKDPDGFTYVEVGTYDVSLEVINRGICPNDTLYKDYVTVKEVPTISYTVSDTTVCTGKTLEVSVEYKPDSASMSYPWDLDGGIIVSGSIKDKFLVSWAEPGYDKEISLKVIKNDCPSTVIREKIDVYPTPVADFTYDAPLDLNPVESQCGSYTLKLSDNSVNENETTEYEWNFGETKEIFKGPDQTYTWDKVGTYDVTLKVTNNDKCFDEKIEPSLVTVKPVGTVVLDALDPQICQGKSARINISRDYTAEGDIQWNLDDGYIIEEKSDYIIVKWDSYGEKNVNLKFNLNGCNSNSNTVVIDVVKTPEAKFSMNPKTGCGFAEVTFVNETTNKEDDISYTWELEEKVISKEDEDIFKHTYTGAQETYVTLTAINKSLCDKSYTSPEPIVVVDKPTADFIITSPELCEGKTTEVKYEGTSLSTANLKWYTSGADKKGTDKEFTLEWSTPGEKTVHLFVDQGGCISDKVEKKVTVIPYPTVDFSAVASHEPEGNNFAYCGDTLVQFINKTTDTIAGHTFYEWNFGDTSPTAKVKSPQHEYKGVGFYNVSLEVRNKMCRRTKHYNDFIEIKEIPVSDFNISADVPKSSDDRLACTDDIFTVQYKGAYDLDNKFDWEYSGGQVKKEAYTDALHKVYWSEDGDRKVSLTVTKRKCKSVETIVPVTIVDYPEVNFSWDPISSDNCGELEVQFNDLSNDVVPLDNSYNWSFGDNEFDDQEEPAHVYKKTGSHNVVLEITNKGICTATSKKETKINVVPIPIADFTVSATDLCVGKILEIDRSNSKNIIDGVTTYDWKFGPGGSPTGIDSDEKRFVTWDVDGDKEISLTLYTDGCVSNTKTQTIKSILTPIASFTPNNTEQCGKDAVIFTDKTTNTYSYPYTKYQWDFGDHTNSHEKGDDKNQMKHEYKNYGVYDVELVVSNDICSDTAKLENLEIKRIPVADFILSDARICQDVTLYGGISNKYKLEVTNNSTTGKIGSAKISNNWIMMGAQVDGDKDDAKFKVYYPSSGEKEISLVLEQDECFSDTLTRTLEVLPVPNAEYIVYGDKVNLCGRDFVRFLNKTDHKGFSGITKYKWDFDDKSTAVDENPKHYFEPHDMPYEPTLTVTYDNLCSNSSPEKTSILVRSLPSVSFKNVDDNVCIDEPLEVNVEGASTANYEYFWKLDGGKKEKINGFDTHVNVTWMGGDTGMQTMSLKVRDGKCESEEIFKDIEVIKKPKVDFHADKDIRESCGDIYFSLLADVQDNRPDAIFEWEISGKESSIAYGSNTSIRLTTPGKYSVKLTVKNGNCEIYEYKEDFLEVYDRPIGDFTIEVPSNTKNNEVVCLGGIITVKNKTVGDGIAKWEFFDDEGKLIDNYGFIGDNDPETEFNVKFNSSGSKKITLVETNGICPAKKIEKWITVSEVPNVDFTIQKGTEFTNSVCGADKVMRFNNVSDNTYETDTKYEWILDGPTVTSDLRDASYGYPTVGTRDVTLKVTNHELCSRSISKKIFIMHEPVTKFSIVDDAVDVCVNSDNNDKDWIGIKMLHEVNPENTVEYKWDLSEGISEGNLDKGEDFKVRWAENAYKGNRKIRLTIIETDKDNGKTCSTKYDMDVEVIPYPEIAFDTKLLENDVVNAVSKCGKHNVKFENKTDQRYEDTYTWYFGDGQTSSDEEPKHDYLPRKENNQEPTEYYPQLIVKNKNKCQRQYTATDPIVVYPMPKASFTTAGFKVCDLADMQINPDITYNKNKGNVTWYYNDEKEVSGEPDNTHTVKWDLSDGKGKQRNIRLTVTQFENCTVNVDPKTIDVIPNPVVDFYIDANGDNVNNEGDQIVNCGASTFTIKNTTDVSTIDDIAYSWRIINSSEDTVTMVGTESPMYLFNLNKGASEKYSVELDAVNSGICPVRVIKDSYVFIKHNPSADFGLSNDRVCEDSDLKITPNVEVELESNPEYEWTFDKEVVIRTDTVSFDKQWSKFGNVDIQLKVKQNGCEATSPVKSVEVVKMPIASFTVNRLEDCGFDEPFEFRDASMNLSGNVKHKWDFGDYKTDDKPIVKHKYTETGKKIVSLEVTNDGLCTDITTGVELKTINVKEIPEFDIVVSKTSNTYCTGETIVLQVNHVKGCDDDTEFNWTFSETPEYLFGNDNSNSRLEVSYDIYGDKNVKLEAVSQGCESAVKSEQLYVIPAPSVNIMGNKSYDGIVECGTAKVAFENASEEKEKYDYEYTWSYGNKEIETTKSPISNYTYTDVGEYDVSLSIKVNNVCSVKRTKYDFIRVKQVPNVGFEIYENEQEYVKGNPVDPKDLSFCSLQDIFLVADDSDFEEDLNYAWEYSDGFVVIPSEDKDDQERKIHFTGYGKKTISLTSELDGCTSNAEDRDIDIIALPETDFTIDFGSAFKFDDDDKPFACEWGDFVLTSTYMPVYDDDETKYIYEYFRDDKKEGSNDGSVGVLTEYSSMPGVYGVALTIINKEKCSNTLRKDDLYEIRRIPESKFSLDKGAICQHVGNFFDQNKETSVKCTYDGETVGKNAIFKWDVGSNEDGGLVLEDLGDNANISYTQFGDKTVSLELIEDGCSHVSERIIKVLPYPIADFKAAETEGCAPFIAELSDSSENLDSDLNNIQYKWEIDEVESNGFNNSSASILVPTAGKYTVRYTVTNGNICSNTVVKEQELTVYDLGVPYFDCNTAVCRGDEMEISYMNMDIVNDKTLFKWVIDGGVTEKDVSQLGASFKIKWDTPGMKKVELKVEQGACKSELAVQDIKVINYPMANFHAINEIGCAPFVAEFVNNSDKIEKNVTYEWEFSNDEKSVSTEPSILFTDPGFYDAKLIVNNTFCRDTLKFPAYIEVIESPIADFSASKYETIASEAVISFKGNGIGDDIKYFWEMGDNTQYEGKDINHKYNGIGDFEVTLTVESKAGCTDMFTRNIAIYPDDLFVPNAFCPEGFNKKFEVKANGITEFEIVIFDRWGQAVFKSMDVNHSWNGRFDGREAPEGTYTYKATYRNRVGEKRLKKGTIILIR
ncbi:MAG: PKD domain-containing protein [Hyphomicrobiales bacterium]